MTRSAASYLLHARIARLLATPAAGGAVARALNDRYRREADRATVSAETNGSAPRRDHPRIDPLDQCHVSARSLLPGGARSP